MNDIPKPKRTVKKEPRTDTRIGKYFVNRKLKNMNKKAAQLDAGFSGGNHGLRIEATKSYQALEEFYRDVIIKKMSLTDIADEHIKNIKQDKDLGAKNKAIEMALDRIEPEKAPTEEREIVMFKLK